MWQVSRGSRSDAPDQMKPTVVDCGSKCVLPPSLDVPVCEAARSASCLHRSDSAMTFGEPSDMDMFECSTSASCQGSSTVARSTSSLECSTESADLSEPTHSKQSWSSMLGTLESSTLQVRCSLDSSVDAIEQSSRMLERATEPPRQRPSPGRGWERSGAPGLESRALDPLLKYRDGLGHGSNLAAHCRHVFGNVTNESAGARTSVRERYLLPVRDGRLERDGETHRGVEPHALESGRADLQAAVPQGTLKHITQLLSRLHHERKENDELEASLCRERRVRENVQAQIRTLTAEATQADFSLQRVSSAIQQQDNELESGTRALAVASACPQHVVHSVSAQPTTVR
uniref:Uncharacterized protein n=1 Tax=Noctiluca scintillans TaxID=2966 RepID=A0A7S1F160_NOCSC